LPKEKRNRKRKQKRIRKSRFRALNEDKTPRLATRGFSFLGLEAVLAAFFPALEPALIKGVNDCPQDADTHDGIGNGEEFAQVGFGGNVPVADSGKGDGAEIEGVEPGEMFNIMIKGGANTQEGNGDS